MKSTNQPVEGDQLGLFLQEEPASSKAIPEHLNDEVNSNRTRLAPFYNGRAKPNPSVSFGNEGTGFGKSYSVIHQYLQNCPAHQSGQPHHNLIFITPQKAQIKFDAGLLQDAEIRRVKFLSFLSRPDLSDLDFTGWITEKRNENLYKSWVKRITGAHYTEVIGRLNYLVLTLRQMLNEHQRLTIQNGDDKLIERVEADIEDIKRDLLRVLTTLAQTVLRETKGGKFITIQERLAATGTRDLAFIEVIDHLLPFERAKLMPSILVATTARFQFSTYLTAISKSGEPIIRSVPFDYILGAKKQLPTPQSNKDQVPYPLGKPHEEQVGFLTDHFFQTDDDSHFKKNNIDFTLVVDEEHISYDVFFENTHKKMIDPKSRISHVFAAIYRLVQPIMEMKNADTKDIVLYEPRKAFSDNLFSLYKNRCDTTVSLETILSMCEKNLGHIVIDTSEVEQIINISKNIFSFSAKRFYATRELKKIRIKEQVNGSELLIYYDRGDSNDLNPTLHDFLQAMICALSACSGINDPDLIGLIRHGQDDSQNNLLAKFITNARENRAHINALFDRTDNDDIYIDEFYTYIAPKIVFSLERLTKLDFDSRTKHERIYVAFRLDLFLELPEVPMMRILHNTTNSVMCLSATTGFKNIYSGCYSRNMLGNFGGNPTTSNLDYRVLSRSAADQDAMEDLRTSRAKARSVSAYAFHDSDRNKISAHTDNPEFSGELRFWIDQLKPYFYDRNRYRVAAFQRQVEAMLLAAWDAKNTMILSLNNRFQSTFISFLKANGYGRLKRFRSLFEEKVFEIQPFKNGIKLRVILFDAALDKKEKIDKFLTVDANTRIAFISSYKSAGTGLNLVIHDQVNQVDEDFERLILINSPFYSKIMGDEGLNTAINHILLLKHYAAGTPVKLEDFESNVLHAQNRRLLNREHQMEILKVIIQAIGRIERRDTFITSEIFMPRDVLDFLIVQYARLRHEGNDLTINSLSLLNHSVMRFCLQESRHRMFASQRERDDFAAKTLAAGMAIDEFFKVEFRQKVLGAARQGDIEAAKFNEALRDIRSIINPRAYVKNLLASPLVKSDPYYQAVIKGFYIWPEEHKGKLLCSVEENPYALTDLDCSDQPYQPHEWLIPNNLKNIGHEENPATRILQDATYLDTRGLEQNPPHPALLPMLRGNIGEHLFSRCLQVLGIKPMTIAALFQEISPKAYEQFDAYVRTEGRLICVDVKYWSPSMDREEVSLKLVDSARQKRDKIMVICKALGLVPTFIYVNTRHDENAMKPKEEFTEGSSIHYMNLFKELGHYSQMNQSPPEYELCNEYFINPQLIEILQGVET